MDVVDDGVESKPPGSGVCCDEVDDWICNRGKKKRQTGKSGNGAGNGYESDYLIDD